MKLWHNEGEPQGHLLDAPLSKLLPVKTKEHIGREGSRVGKMGETGRMEETKRSMFSAMYSVISGTVFCPQTNPTSSCTKLLLNDLHDFLGKTSKSKSMTWYVLQEVLHTSAKTTLKDRCNVIYMHCTSRI
jgi:hypothetical protein